MPTICQFKIKINKKQIEDVTNIVVKSVHQHYLNVMEIEKHLDEIKKDVLDRTEIYIDAKRRRPSSPTKIGKKLMEVLRETAFVEKLDNSTWRLSMGNEETLDEEVPYWRVINYGGKPWGDAKFLGVFEDGAPVEGGQGNAWIDGGNIGGRSFMMVPKNPIPPMKYINFMSKEFKRAIEKYKSKVKR